MKIVDYYIVVLDTLSQVEILVNSKIRMGYTPYGDIILEDTRYIQVMVKYEDEKKTSIQPPHPRTLNILDFIYCRMIEVHGENSNVDYMINFRDHIEWCRTIYLIKEKK